MDPFSTLGVSRDASTEDIKDAFRKAALQWHPDRHVGGGAAVQALAAQRFSEVRLRERHAHSRERHVCLLALAGGALQRASLSALTHRVGAQISRAYEWLTDPSRRRNGGEWRQRQERARPSEGWRERSAYTGAQSTAGSGPYEWRHANMDGTRAAAEEGAQATLTPCCLTVV
jgi:curved DNA-binding protein CbpA